MSGTRFGLDSDLGVSQQKWLLTSVVGFFSVSVIFLIFQNPQLDIQNLFIGRVQFIQSHALYSLWLGYGILLSVAWLERMFGRKALLPAMAVSLLLPGILLWQNGYDEEQLRIVGGAEQNGHDYGWQFGNWGLRGRQGHPGGFPVLVSRRRGVRPCSGPPTPTPFRRTIRRQ